MDLGEGIAVALSEGRATRAAAKRFGLSVVAVRSGGLACHLTAVARDLKPAGRLLGGWAALRADTTDYMPLAGPLFAAAVFRQDFAGLHHGCRLSACPAAR